MINIINMLFEHYGFSGKEINNGYFYTKKTTPDYWVVIKEDVNTLLENQKDYFTRSKELCQEDALDKNISMLVLWETAGTIEREQFKRKKMNLEEDPYYFKKYVLGYSKQELLDLEGKIKDNNGDAVDFIERNIISKETFNLYKPEPFVKEWYSLLYRIAIKIPFLRIKISESQGLESLFAQNDSALKDAGIFDFNNEITKIIDKYSPEGLKEIYALDLFQLLWPKTEGIADGS